MEKYNHQDDSSNASDNALDAMRDEGEVIEEEEEEEEEFEDEVGNRGRNLLFKRTGLNDDGSTPGVDDLHSPGGSFLVPEWTEEGTKEGGSETSEGKKGQDSALFRGGRPRMMSAHGNYQGIHLGAGSAEGSNIRRDAVEEEEEDAVVEEIMEEQLSSSVKSRSNTGYSQRRGIAGAGEYVKSGLSSSNSNITGAGDTEGDSGGDGKSSPEADKVTDVSAASSNKEIQQPPPSSSGYYEEDEDDDEDLLQSEVWKQQDKHFFLLSNAGKPIFSMHGNEQKLSTFMGVIQAMMSFLQDDDDVLRSMKAGKYTFVFQTRGPVYMVAISKTSESENHLRTHLTYLYSHIISVLTAAQLNSIFQKRTNYDLRNLLGHADHTFMKNLSRLIDMNPSLLLSSIQCLRMPSTLRAQLGTMLVNARTSDLMYAILISKYKLITLLRPRRHSLHPSDLHLLFNMINSSTAFKAGESWTPICLPKYNNKGFLHAHVSYVDTDICLLLISNKKEQFVEMHDAREKIANDMSPLLPQLRECIAKDAYNISEIGIPGLRHFIYKSKSTVQLTAPSFEAPYSDVNEQKRLLQLYQGVHRRLHTRPRLLKIHFVAGQYEVVLGWLSSGFELYTTFGPLTTKATAVASFPTLLRWIKREEESLFILNSPVF